MDLTDEEITFINAEIESKFSINKDNLNKKNKVNIVIVEPCTPRIIYKYEL